MASTLSDYIVVFGIPLITGLAGFLVSELRHKRQRLRSWADQRAGEIVEQREDIHTVMHIGEGSRATIEATIDYRFRKLFESTHQPPLNSVNAQKYECLIKELFAKNSFDRRDLTPDDKALLSVEINQICVDLETLIEQVGSKRLLF